MIGAADAKEKAMTTTTRSWRSRAATVVGAGCATLVAYAVTTSWLSGGSSPESMATMNIDAGPNAEYTASIPRELMDRIRLVGLSGNIAAGQASALIEVDGTQRSISLGREIVPGLILTSIENDRIQVTFNGAQEAILLSSAVGQVDESFPAITVIAKPLPGKLGPKNLTRDIAFEPRFEEGMMLGITVENTGAHDALQPLGLEPGDIVVSVDGQPFTYQKLDVFGARIAQGGSVRLRVIRQGRTVSVVTRAR